MASSALRSFDVSTLGGEGFGVSVPQESTLGDLLTETSKEKELGFCFSLLTAAGEVLDDPARPLPEDSKLQCVVENISILCNEAQELLRSTPFTTAPTSPNLSDLRFGPCRWLGSFYPSQRLIFEEIASEDLLSDLSDDEFFEEDVDEDGPKGIAKHVYELTLLDGENKRLRLIAVIRPGFVGTNDRIPYNRGMTGPIYLRPGFELVGQIQHTATVGSEWVLDDTSWYKEAEYGLPLCEDCDFGGGYYETSAIQTHLTHALLAANSDRLKALEAVRRNKLPNAMQGAAAGNCIVSSLLQVITNAQAVAVRDLLDREFPERQGSLMPSAVRGSPTSTVQASPRSLGSSSEEL